MSGGRVRKEIVVGARGSTLSVAQTMQVIRRFSRLFPEKTFILKKITTLGDRVRDWGRDARGIFVREIEDELRSGRIDCAVHSLKDMPSRLARGLCLGAVTRREDPRDVIISRSGWGILDLPRHALVGTTSLRRQSQLRSLRPDLRVEGLRGNLDTRVRKLDSGEYDAIIVARAGLRRLGIIHPGMRVIPESFMLPACGQGSLAVEVRAKDAAMLKMARAINDPVSSVCAECERAFIRTAGGGCRLPVAVRARMRLGKVYLTGMISRIDGTSRVRVWGSAPTQKSGQLAESLARNALRNGGAGILKEIENEP